MQSFHVWISACPLEYTIFSSKTVVSGLVEMDGSAVQSACCSCKGLAFNSQNPHGCTQPPVALIPGDLLLNSPGYTRHAHGVIHVCRQTFGHIELSNLERIIEAERCLSVIIPLESLLAGVIFHFLSLPHMPAVLPSSNKTASSKACRDSREQFYHMDTEEISDS